MVKVEWRGRAKEAPLLWRVGKSDPTGACRWWAAVTALPVSFDS